MAFTRIRLTDAKQRVLFEGSLCFLPFSEEFVDRRCREYYQTQVCVVRKESMKMLLCLEIEELLVKRTECEDAVNLQKPKRLPGAVRDMLSPDMGELFYQEMN